MGNMLEKPASPSSESDPSATAPSHGATTTHAPLPSEVGSDRHPAEQAAPPSADGTIPSSHVVPRHPTLRPSSDAPLSLGHLARFVGAGLAGGEGVIVIAAAPRCEALRVHLSRNAFDVSRALATGQLVIFDTDETLAECMLDDHVDPARFFAAMLPLVDRCRRGRSGVRAALDMLDVLRARGRRDEAELLARLWNELADEHAVLLSFGASLSFGAASDITVESEHARTLDAELERLRENAGRERRTELRRVRGPTLEHRLLVSVPASIWILRGPNLLVEFANPMALALLPEHNPVGAPMGEAFPGFAPERLSLIERVLYAGERHVETEVPSSFDWNGTGRIFERFFNFSYEPYLDEHDAVVGVIVFGFEVTDWVVARRRVEAVVRELEIANRMKDDFLATVSHELRTPLSAILGWTRMLRGGMVADSQKQKALETIERNANAQTQLIEDLLDVSRIISGKMRLEVEDVDVEVVIANAVEAVRPAASAKGVTLSHDVDPSTGSVRGDGGRLQQVVWNLLSNGVKFTPTGGQVEIVARKRDAFVEIVVSDDGQGIDAEFLPYVFERFRQADATTTRKHMGLGLGLAIVRHLVELHGGHVSVESAGHGKGASFVVGLPTSQRSSTTVAQPPVIRSTISPSSLPPPTELEGARILVVEDEDDARELLLHVLGPCKIHALTAASVSEALAKVESERPDIIVSDIGLPEEDGYAFIRKLRALPPNRGGRTPAIALTAYARVEDRTKALASGFNTHVPKPVEPAELVAALASLWALFPRG